MKLSIGDNSPIDQGGISAMIAGSKGGIFPHMQTTFKQALEQALKKTGRSLRSVAIAANVSYEQLKSLQQGKSQKTNVDDAMKVAGAFGVTLDDFYIGRLRPDDCQSITIAGRVGAGAKVPLFDHTEDGGLFHVAAPAQILRQGPPCNVSAVEVEGDSMSPMYQSGDILFFTRHTHDGIPDEDIGRPCVVEDANGMAWVKQVKRGDAPGLFHLISLNPTSETMHNVPIKWAARVKLALPAEMVERI